MNNFTSIYEPQDDVFWVSFFVSLIILKEKCLNSFKNWKEKETILSPNTSLIIQFLKWEFLSVVHRRGNVNVSSIFSLSAALISPVIAITCSYWTEKNVSPCPGSYFDVNSFFILYFLERGFIKLNALFDIIIMSFLCLSPSTASISMWTHFLFCISWKGVS